MLTDRVTPGRAARLVLSPPPADRLPRRLGQLFVGLVLYGVSDALLVLAGLGLDPWDVLHQGLARRTGIPLGTWSIIVGAAVLVIWVPLRQRPGIGTACNVVVIGTVIDLVLGVVPAPHALPVRWASLLGGVALNGVATACYIGAGLGPGPRDGLMTGIARRGHSLRVVRTSIELSVLATGWLLGGTVGIGTLLYAVGIGPLVHVLLPRFTIRPGPGRAQAAGSHPERVGRGKGKPPSGGSVDGSGSAPPARFRVTGRPAPRWQRGQGSPTRGHLFQSGHAPRRADAGRLAGKIRS